MKRSWRWIWTLWLCSRLVLMQELRVLFRIWIICKSMFIWQNDTTSYFSISLKFRACYITGQSGDFQIKTLLYIFIYFFGYFFVFCHKISVFIIFNSFFDEVSNFHNRILANQKHELAVSNCQRNCMGKLAP